LKQAQGAARVEALDAAAELAMKRKAFTEAERLLGELAAIPEAAQTRALAELHGRRAQALAELGRTDEAAMAFEKAIAADTLKMYAEKYAFQRGQMLLETKRNDAALAAWDAFLKDFPKSPRAEAAAYNRIFALLRLDRKSEAAHEIEMMLQGAKTDEAKDALRLLLYSSLGEGAALSVLKVNEAERQSITDALLDGRELVKKFSCNDCHLLIEPQMKSLQQTCVECDRAGQARRHPEDASELLPQLHAHPAPAARAEPLWPGRARARIVGEEVPRESLRRPAASGREHGSVEPGCERDRYAGAVLPGDREDRGAGAAL
jgi:tetratricopeptide (TPR) repeat protein